MFRIAALVAALALTACTQSVNTRQPSAAAEAQAVPATAARQADPLLAVLAGSWRDPKNTARDVYRHPRETLHFFGLEPTQTVVEITPGGGWYAEILAPYLHHGGHYIAAVAIPTRKDGEAARDKDALATRFAADPARYGNAARIDFDPKAPVFGPPGSADLVLTFRNVHNWIGNDTAATYFKAFFAVLKPGGTLGVVDHRAKPGTPLEKMKDSGYLTEQTVIDLATAAGFVLDGKSEVNANPKDTADHPNGVWTLPPSNQHDAEDDARYKAIGESDRMTLRFRKPSGE